MHYAGFEQLQPLMEQHRLWVEKHSAEGTILLAGPITSLEGGVIIAQCVSHSAFEAILRQDPFFNAGLVKFDIVEFVPRRGALRSSLVNPLFLNEQQQKKAFSGDVDWADVIKIKPQQSD